jgi:hypothetical protein
VNSRLNIYELVLQVYKQKVKHLHYEHQNDMTTLKTQGEMEAKVLADTQRNKEFVLKKSNKAAKTEIKEQEIAQEDIIKNLKQVSRIVLVCAQN